MAAKFGGFGGGRMVVGGGRSSGGRSGVASGPASSGASRGVGNVRVSTIQEGGKKGVTLIPHARPPIERPSPTQAPKPAPKPASAPTPSPEKPKGALKQAGEELANPTGSSTTRPRVHAYFLPDGTNVATYKYIKDLTLDLDAASRCHLDIRMIGDPSQSGPVARSYRTPEEAQTVPTQADHYVERVIHRARETFHVLEECIEQARLLGITEEQLPCIAFVDSRTGQLLIVLAIEREWGESEPARHALGRILLRDLRAPSVVAALTQFDGEAKSTAVLVAELARLGQAISHEVARVTDNTELAKRVSVPAGTLLHLVRSGSQAYFRGKRLELSVTPFRLLLALAESPGTFLGTEELARRAGRWGDDFSLNLVSWGADHKLEIMKALRELEKQGAVPESKGEIDGLITGKNGAYQLNLTKEQVWIQ